MYLFYLAMKSVMTRKLRSVLSVIGFSFAVCGFVSFISVSRGLSAAVGEYYRRIDGMYAVGEGSLDPVFSTLPAALDGPLSEVEGVLTAVPEVWCFAFSIDGKNALTKGILSFVTVGGIDVALTASLPGGGVYFGSLTLGRILTEADSDHALISERMAAEYGKTVGSSIKVNDRTLIVAGLYKTGSLFLDSALIVPLETGYRISRKDPGTVSSYYLVLKDGTDGEEVARRISSEFSGMDVKRSSTLADDFGGILSNVDVFIMTVIAFSAVLSVIIIMNTMLMNVAESRREFGIMLAEGWMRRDLSRLVLYETLVLSWAGCLAGNFLALAVHAVLTWILPFEPVFSLPTLILSVLSATGAGILGGAVPVLRLKSIHAGEVLRSL